MSFVEWSNDLSVQVEEIDNQHKVFIDLINKFYNAIQEKSEASVVESILNDLVIYAVVHFDTEEQYFDKFHYELSDEHKKIHKGFLEKIQKIRDEYKEGKPIVDELMDFMKAWLVSHIKDEDHKYIKCFSEHGLR